MKSKKTISIIMGVALTLVTILGAVSYGIVSAQSSTPNANTPAAQNNTDQRGPRQGKATDGYSEQNLADALGVSLSDLQTAEQTATSAALKEAVSAGLITQAQADQFTQNQAKDQHFGGLPFLHASSIDYDKLLADALGITTDQLQTAKQKASFAVIDQAVKDGKMTQDQADAIEARYTLTNNSAFQTAMKSAYENAVNQAVSNGVITQAQADLLLKNSSGMEWGGMGGPGGGPNHGGTAPDQTGNPPSGAPTTAPSSGSGG